MIHDVALATAAHGAAVPVSPLVDTLKRVDGDRVIETVDRRGLATVQTPQGIRAGSSARPSPGSRRRGGDVHG